VREFGRPFVLRAKSGRELLADAHLVDRST